MVTSKSPPSADLSVLSGKVGITDLPGAGADLGLSGDNNGSEPACENACFEKDQMFEHDFGCLLRSTHLLFFFFFLTHLLLSESPFKH